MNTKHGTLVLVRHGESRFNTLNLFTGWIDIPLSRVGISEAQRAAKHCMQFNYDAAYTSHLERAHETLLIILSEQTKIGVFQHEQNSHYAALNGTLPKLKKRILPIFTTADLNERAYGALQGVDKNTANRRYGRAQVFAWRRSYLERPPGGESLKDVFTRVMTYFAHTIHPRIQSGETVLIVGHGNTLRAVIKFLENIDDEKILSVDLPFARPLVYTCLQNHFFRTEGTYTLRRPLR